MGVETIPILPSRDFDETIGFYALLGFGESGRWPDSYLIVAHPIGIELHFFWHPRLSPQSNDHGAYVRFGTAAEIDALHAEWATVDLGGGTLTTPSDTDFGLREFALLDPMRNLLRIGGFLPAQPSK
jgi:hypothetical protein